MNDEVERLEEDLAQARRRAAELEATVAAQRAEIGDLRLQVDVLGTLDPASGLPNLSGVVDLVDAAGRRLDRDGESFGVMALEMPALAGEAVRQAGAVVSAALRRVDRVGWAGSGGFVVVLPGVTAEGATTVVSRITAVVEGVLDHPVRMALVLCARPPSPEAFRVVDRARRVAGHAAPGEPVVEAYSGPLDW